METMEQIVVPAEVLIAIQGAGRKREAKREDTIFNY